MARRMPALESAPSSAPHHSSGPPPPPPLSRRWVADLDHRGQVGARSGGEDVGELLREGPQEVLVLASA